MRKAKIITIKRHEAAAYEALREWAGRESVAPWRGCCGHSMRGYRENHLNTGFQALTAFEMIRRRRSFCASYTL
jgi:hypothetical protein